MDMRRLLLSGLFNFSLLFLAVIFGFLQYLRDFGIFDFQDWITPENADAAAARFTFGAALSLAVFLLVAGMLTGLLRTVARDWRFRLTHTGRGLRRRRGLLTLSEVVIPLHRIQLALSEQGPLQRAFGFHRLFFQTLGGGDGKEASGLQEAAPLATTDDALSIVAEAGLPGPPDSALLRAAPRRSLLRRCALPAVLAIVSACAALIDLRALFATAAFLLICGGTARSWSRQRHATTEQALYVIKGPWRRRSWTVPHHRLQMTHVRQGPLQRALGLASLVPDTAGGSAFRQPELIDLDVKEAEALALELRTRSKAARAGLRR